MTGQVTTNIFLGFSADRVEEPVVYRLATDYRLIPNIMKASISPDKQGYLVLSLTGDAADLERALTYLRELGLTVSLLTEHVSWDEQSCTQCGACTAVCPTGALAVRRPDMTVRFNGDKCMVCQICILACPVKAVHLDF